MGGEEIQIKERSLSYTGIFSLKHIFQIIYDYLEEHGYDRSEKVHEIQHRKEGKFGFIKADPSKEINEDIEFDLEYNVIISKCEEVEVNNKGQKEKLDKGTIRISLGGTMYIDAKDKFAKYGGLGWLLRYIGHVFVFREQYQQTTKYCQEDVDGLRDSLLNYFNALKFNR